DLDTFHHRHPQVEQGHIWLMELEGLDGFDTVAGLGDDPEVGLVIDDVGDAGSEEGVIVDKKDARPVRLRERLSWQRAPVSGAGTAPRPARPLFRSAAR